MDKKYDVIVIGGGHAGCEAAFAAARRGMSTLLVTLKKSAIGHTSCNPSIGGVGKGQLVKEVDALGGEMAKAADACAIQFRMLNTSKGYAARSTRVQIDRKRYNEYMLAKVTTQTGLDVEEDEVKEIIVSSGVCEGVRTAKGNIFRSQNVVLTPGTFMNGVMHIGLEHFSGGRMGEEASKGLSDNLSLLGFKVSSLKTGTPARLDGRTIDFSCLEKHPGDSLIIPFSFSTKRVTLPQMPCYMTRTNKNTHRIIKENLDRSPLYTGKIRSTGVRYCPSIEDKVTRFPERDSHIIFLEPEGLDTDEYYPNGVSTSLPVDAQEKMLRSIKGLENVVIIKPAYGIEYDYVDPIQLYPTLESKHIKGLFMAGQINGTTGYEEAAALGLMAGINASAGVRGEEKLVLKRSQAYIGVLIDDLVTKGSKEPYRMFTSRVEYRIVIREDNADTRLSWIGHERGLVSKEALGRVHRKEIRVSEEKKRLDEVTVSPGGMLDPILREKGEVPLAYRVPLSAALRRPTITYDDIQSISGGPEDLSYQEKVAIEVDIKYAGYVEREMDRIKKFSDLEKINIPEGFAYSGIPGLSNEVVEKLTKLKPRTLGQASRVSGITPAAISLLMVKVRSGYEGKRIKDKG